MPSRGAKANRGPSAAPGNRRALIEAAREIFADGGYRAPLNAVARRAGVGQGSLYRHFPDRTALAVAVFEENITELEGLAGDPETDLELLFDRVSGQAIASTAFIDMVFSAADDPRVTRLGSRIEGVVLAVLERDRTRGRIAGHVTVADVTLAVSMLAGALARTPPAERDEVARRARAIFHAAFRAS